MTIETAKWERKFGKIWINGTSASGYQRIDSFSLSPPLTMSIWALTPTTLGYGACFSLANSGDANTCEIWSYGNYYAFGAYVFPITSVVMPTSSLTHAL
jgi:hypothetical protein